MPGKIKVKILAGRNLPVMDRSGDTTDAYVEIKFGNTTYKTDVCRKSLNPQWNSEWYKFEVEDAELQDEPLQIRLMDHDTYSANDAIGKVYVNLNPLLLPGVPPPVKNIWTLEASMNSSTGSQGGSVMTGWLPVFDTMHGIRGEVKIIVKVELFLDFNKFRQSSCGVTFFYSPIVPHGYHAQVIHGFVEELVVSDDPEYKWIDKIRTPRASNEARQTLFLKLSNEVQRKIGLKALDLGGNAIIGYLQNFDLEGESGIVARGIGTVVTLVKVHDLPQFLSEASTADDCSLHNLKLVKPVSDCSESEGGSPRLPSRHHYHHHHHHSNSTTALNNVSPVSSPTVLSTKFPLYGENVPLQPVTPLKVVECKNPLIRQPSIQSYTSVNLRRNPLMTGSNLSLSDDVIDELSLRQMMALEDMRGEPQGNRFSRGLRNLRYLPQNVKRSLKSSVDDESDLESAYSSTWSVCGSDTTSLRSMSIVDLQQNIRRKKFTHRKTTSDGMAAMLIRSVHSGGLPLDIVKEDRETPTPSPVNFIDDNPVEDHDSSSPLKSDKDNEEETLIKEPEIMEKESSENNSNKMLLVTYSKLKAPLEDDAIPMISSSETDTSSSEDDDDDDEEDDDPSESSTNYNILDDTLSLLDPSSPEAESCPLFSDSQMKLYPASTPTFTSQLAIKEGDKEEKEALINAKDDDKDEQKNILIMEKDTACGTAIIEKIDLIDGKEAREEINIEIIEQKYREEKKASMNEKDDDEEREVRLNEKDEVGNVAENDRITELLSKKDEKMLSMPPPLAFEGKARNNFSADEILSSEYSSDIDSDFPASSVSDDSRIKRSIKKHSSPSRIPFKSEDEKTQRVKEKRRSDSLHRSVPAPSSPEYFEERESLLPALKSHAAYPSPDKSAKNGNNKSPRHHRLHKQLSVVQDEDFLSESSEDEYYAKKRPALPAKVPEKRLLIDLDDEHYQSSSAEQQRGKSPRRVERTDTVIYKGPKEKNLLDSSNVEPPHWPAPLSPTVVKPSPALLARLPSTDANHLQVPGVNLKDIVPNSPYPPDELAAKDRPKSVIRLADEEARVAEMINRKYRQSCMHELIRVIDSRMIAHHRTDSQKWRRHLAATANGGTPSPEAAHRRMAHHRHSRSRSPDSLPPDSLQRHHHHSSSHHLAKHSRSHHNSCESIVQQQQHLVPEPVMRHLSEELEEAVELEAAQQLAQNAPSGSRKLEAGERLEMHALKVRETPRFENSLPPTRPTTLTGSSTNASETKTTNPANATDCLCVSHSPSARRQQQNNHQEPPPPPAQQPQQQGSSVSPADNRQPQQQPQLQQSPQQPLQQQQQQQQHQKLAHSPAARNPGIPLHRRSSDSDLSITPKDNKSFKKGRSFRLRSDRSRYPSRSMLSEKSSHSHSGNSLTGSDRSMGGYLKPNSGIARTMNQEALEMLEYPFITMQQYPPGFVLHIGGFVSARSVKLLERITNLEEPEGRDSWWTEIRMEVRSHARALACNVVIGYKEETSICDDVCVLSGSGTAAMINLHSTGQDQDNVLITHVQGPMTTSIESDKAAAVIDKNPRNTPKDGIIDTPLTQQTATPLTNSTDVNSQSKRSAKQRLTSESNDHEPSYVFPSSGCSLCHLPYNKSSMNFQVSVSKCAVCRRAKVPDVLFTTVELPENIPMTGRGCFIQATVCKAKKDLRGELNAKEISDCLPFLEYELHSLLLNKLRVRGMNAVFGLKVQVSVGERFIIGMAVGTAVYLTALPAPSLPRIATGNSWTNEEQLAEIQKSLVETVKKNMEFYQLKHLQEAENGRSMSDTDESEDELPELDLGVGMKDVCVLEVDDVEDMDRINLLMDERPPNDFHVVNTETIPGLEDLEIVRNLQMFTQVSRAKIPSGQSASMPSKYFARLLQTVFFKLRRMVPCALCDLQFKIAMPEQDEIQLSVVGMALGLGEPTKFNKFRRRVLSHSMSKDQVKKTDDNDMIFSLDEDHAENLGSGETTPNLSNAPIVSNMQSATLNTVTVQKTRPRSPLRIKHTTHRHKHVPLKERYGVDITPLSYLPGGRIERYLGNLNFFFIRESNSIRENGGLSGFIHSFVTEVLAIVRAHVSALGGNAIVAFFMSQCVLLHSPHKNQGQCLINVGGDVVNVSYFGNDKQQQPSASSGNC